jgi:hypothetical protein
VPGVPPVPLGIYDSEDDIPGVDSIRLPDGDISRWIRDTTRLAERIEDALPGARSPFTRGL